MKRLTSDKDVPEVKYQKLMVGQEVFTVHEGAIVPRRICKIKEWWNDYYGFRGEYVATAADSYGRLEFDYNEFGKTVFLTQEDALNEASGHIGGSGRG